MRLEQIAGATFDRLFSRFLRRAALALALAFFAVVAVYHFTAAGMLTLELKFGALNAQLIVAGIFTAMAVISYAILWAMGRKTANASAPALSAPRQTLIALLIEAVMLGYSSGKKKQRSR